MRGDNTRKHYLTLGLEPGASHTDVKRAYRALAKTWHPDRFSRSPFLQQQALEKFQTINHAYTALCRQQLARRMAGVSPQSEPSPTVAHSTGQTPRQGSRLRAIPAWGVALTAFLVLRLCFTHVVPLFSLPWPYTDPEAPSGAPRSVSNAPDYYVPPPVVSSPQSVPPLALSAPPPQEPTTFTVGSTKAEVLAIQGPPTSASTLVWEYGGSRVYFRDARVSRWEEWPRSPLKAQLRPASPLQVARDHFTIGSTKDEVLTIQGPPTYFSERVWEYGPSRVYFENERVVRWTEGPRSPLKAKLLPTSVPETVPTYFTVGSTKDEVLAIQGPPTQFTDHVWEYGHSRIYFADNRVVRWDIWRGSPLKARLSFPEAGGGIGPG